MRRGRWKLRFVLPLWLGVLAGCGGGEVVESVPGPVYLLSIENPMPHPMEVRYDDGRTTRDLGLVAANETREFVVAGPARTAIEVIGRDPGGTFSVTREVVLRQGSTAQVVLTP